MAKNEWYKENDFKIVLKDYLWQGDTKSCGLCGMNSAGEAAIADILDGRKNRVFFSILF